ncbi:MAG TPA: gliding motility-associated C-terminal domain-containing protein, partial [Chitinophagales bacterium]|nr:gliding motility-associated C-terminal domain-containing protein [Chitinophagales bacterium]
APGTYTLTVTNTANGCTATDAVTVIIDTIRPLADAGPNKTLTCATTTVTIGTVAISGNSYLWSPIDGLDDPAIAQPSTSTLNNYTVTVTKNSNGCKSSDQVIILQNITNSAAFAGDDLKLTCSNQSYVIGSPATAGNRYSWSPSNGLNDSSIAQPSVNLPGTYTLTVTNIASGCTSTDAVTIGIDTTRPVANAGADKTINCLVNKYTIGTPATGGNTYSWQASSGLSADDIAQPVANTSGIYVLTVTKTSNGCKSTDAMEVLVDTIKPIADAGEDQTFGCPHSTITLGASPSPDLSYLWIRSLGLSENNIAQPTTDTSGTFVLMVTNTKNHCRSAFDTVVISPKNCNCVFYVPTAFTPNNDGINDVLNPFKDCDDYTDLTFSVFNRWGELVFKSNDINSGWNGIYKDESQQVDSYIWTLEYFDVLYNTKRFEKGIVTMLK